MRQFTLIMLILTLISCNINDKNVKVIEVDIKRKNQTGLKIEIDDCVPLETNENSILGQISKLRIGKNGYYILDQTISKSLYLFDFEGKYINKVKNGKGPGEAVYPYDFIYNENLDNILLWDAGQRRIIFYDSMLNYMSHEASKEFILKGAERTSNGKLFTLANYKFPKGCYSYVLYNSRFELEELLIPIKQEYIGYSMNSSISNYYGNILFLMPMDYSIQQYVNGKISSKYFLDFGKRSLSLTDIDKGKDQVKKMVLQEGKIDFYDDLFENKDFIHFSYLSANRHNPHGCIYSKTSNKAYNLKFMLGQEKMPKGKIVGRLNEKYILSVEAEQILKWGHNHAILTNIVHKINLSDNNILVLISLTEK